MQNNQDVKARDNGELYTYYNYNSCIIFFFFLIGPNNLVIEYVYCFIMSTFWPI